MKRGRIKIVPSRLMVLGLGTVLFVLCLAAILMLLPGLTARTRLAERVVGSLQVRPDIGSEQARLENLDRVLLAILQSNNANRSISYLRFVDLDDGAIFTFDGDGTRGRPGDKPRLGNRDAGDALQRGVEHVRSAAGVDVNRPDRFGDLQIVGQQELPVKLRRYQVDRTLA